MFKIIFAFVLLFWLDTTFVGVTISLACRSSCSIGFAGTCFSQSLLCVSCRFNALMAASVTRVDVYGWPNRFSMLLGWAI